MQFATHYYLLIGEGEGKGKGEGGGEGGGADEKMFGSRT